MATLYSKEVAQFIRTRDWPEGGRPIVTEQLEPEPHLYLVFFRDDWITMPREDQWKTTEIVKECMGVLWPKGIPLYVGTMKNRSDLDEV